MLVAIYMAMVGFGQLVAKSGEVRRGKKSRELGKKCIIVTLATYLLYPMVQIFPAVIGIIFAILVILLGLAAQFMMVNYINNGYRDIDMD
jgi:amino acid transporter